MARTRRAGTTPALRLILDSGALIGLSRHDDRARAALAAAWEAGAEVTIPAAVLAETVRGDATDAPINQVVKRVVDVVSIDEVHGRLAGGLLASAGAGSAVDALVVAVAVVAGGGVIVTSDPTDLGALAARHPEVTVRAV